MTKEPIVIFVEDYKNMSKEEFVIYIKKIWNEGYEAGKQESWNRLDYPTYPTYPTYPNITWSLQDKVNTITEAYNNHTSATK